MKRKKTRKNLETGRLGRRVLPVCRIKGIIWLRQIIQEAGEQRLDVKTLPKLKCPGFGTRWMWR